MSVLKYSVLGCLVFMCLLKVSNAQSDKPVIGHINKGEYARALEELSELGDLSADPSLLKLKSLAHLKLGQLAAAEEVYLALSQREQSVEVSNNLGMVYLRQSRFSDAINQFQSTIRGFPADSVAYKNLGDTYLVLAELSYRQGATNTDDIGLADKATSINIELIEAANRKTPGALVPTDNDEQPGESERKEQVAVFVASWLESRRNKDTTAYLKHYSPSFVYVDGEDDSTLVKSLEGAKAKNVGIKEPTIVHLSETEASVVFDEWFGPSSDRKRVFKELIVQLESRNWTILEEKVLFAY